MRNSFEGAALESVDIDRMHGRALETLKASRIAETEQADIEKANELEDKYSKNITEMKKIADIFEAVVLEHGELSNWFGENALTLKTSRFDDYINGVDLLVEFSQEEADTSLLGLAADVTFTSDTTEKFDRLRRQIESGHLAKLRYAPGLSGQDEIEIPEVIIGADRKTVMELADLWAERRQKELAHHRIQIQILKQIEAQLEVLGMYAGSLGKKEIAAAYEDRLGTIRGLLAEKAEIERGARFELSGDMVHESIMSFLSRWKRELSIPKAA